MKYLLAATSIGVLGACAAGGQATSYSGNATGGAGGDISISTDASIPVNTGSGSSNTSQTASDEATEEGTPE